MGFVDFIREINQEISNFLQIRWIKTSYLYLNLWSIVHLFSGFIIIFLIDKKMKKFNHKYLLLLEILVFWELFEMFMRFTGITVSGLFVFKSESVADVLIDIFLGMIGGFIYMKILRSLNCLKI